MPKPANPDNPNDYLLVVKIPFNMKKRISQWSENCNKRTDAEAIRYLLHAGFAYLAKQPAGKAIPPLRDYPYESFFPEERDR